MPDPGLLRDDLNALHRRLRLKSHFESLQNDPDTTLPNATVIDESNLFSIKPFKCRKFKLASTWRGPVGPPTLEAFISSNLANFNNRPVYRRPDKQNLSPEENHAIRSLSGDKSIVIKPADKGAAVVIMNRLDYLREGYRQLSDPAFYRPMETDLTDKHSTDIRFFIEGLYQDGEIEENTRDYLNGRNLAHSQILYATENT